MAHPRPGNLVAVSTRDRWFSYPWWVEEAREPDFALHLDIHRKPGYDPLELFFREGTLQIAQDPGLIQGSHGYPPEEPRDDPVLIVSGEVDPSLFPEEEVRVTDVAGMIEELCRGERKA